MAQGAGTRLIAAAVAVSVAGCAFTTARGPAPGRQPAERPVCTESLRPAQADIVVGGVGMLTMIVMGGYQKEHDDQEDLGVGLILGGLAFGALFYASGTIGYFRIRRCQRAVDEWQRRQGAPGQTPAIQDANSPSVPPAAP